MNKYIGLAVAAILVLSAVNVNGQGKFVPSKSITSGATTPGAAAGVDEETNSFVKVLQKNNVTKWTQTINGIPIYGSVLTTHNDEKGVIQKIQGFVSHTAGLVDTTPVVDERTAIETLRKNWNHSLTSLQFSVEEPQLQILQGEDGWDKLVWKIAYNVELKNFALKEQDVGPVPAYIIGLVNAHTGEVEKTWNNLQHAKISVITGNENIGKKFVEIDVEKSSQTCKHRDASRRVEVFDIWNRRRISSSTTSSFTCENAKNENWDLLSWTGAYSPRNEVFLHATQLVDMWREFMGKDAPLHRTSTSWLNFYVHYDHQYENAFFDGTSFKFGDGKDIFYPLTSLDIVCHEIGHSITQWHGGNMEYQGQSGAMNEAYSDIIGETCDRHYKNRTDGLLATDIMRPQNILGKAMRNMCDPPSIGGSIDHMDKYNSRMDVHSTSGVYNKAWCTLKNSEGWNYVQAFEVFTDANLLYWNPTSTMHCGACGVESAAVDRGYSRSDVTAAFKAVGVSCDLCTRA